MTILRATAERLSPVRANAERLPTGLVGAGPVTGDSFVTPDILNNISFETNFDGLCSSGFGAPTNVTRSAVRAFAGSTSVLRVLPTTSGTDEGASLHAPFYAGSPLSSWTPNPAVPATEPDRLWTRFYFYLDTAIDGSFKFHILFSSAFSEQFGGLYFDAGNLSMFFAPELTGGFPSLTALSGLTGAWHYLEMDYWRNGDPSGNPSVAIWLDGTQFTTSSALPSPATWVDGRVQFGTRGSSAKIGDASWVGILNGVPNNTISGNVWIDRIAVSTAGRIGP